ncbi:MAG: hypothetical protein HQL84_06665 [Magnetococcales bacterium]|nr:hypothetical protein [Magnetococcales bacterium]MBF0149715.1 hypothetical protein [Magnetococcales bacterium]
MKQFFKKSTETIAGMVVGGIAVLTLSSAFAFTLPYTFSNGTPADATQVNANFNALKDNMASPTLVSNGTVEIGALLGFQGSSYSGMTNQGYLFQINNSGALTTISGAVVPLTSTTTLQYRWNTAIDTYRQVLTNSQGTNPVSGYNDGTLYFDNACTVTTAPTLGTPTNSQENTPGNYAAVPSIPAHHVYKIPNDNNVYIFSGDEPQFNGVAETFSFTPYFKATTNGTGTSHCFPFSAGLISSLGSSSNPICTSCPGGMITWSGSLPGSSFSTLLNGGPYFQTYPTNVNNQATTGIPNIGFAAPITIEMR